MTLHVNTAATKGDALGLQAESLLKAGFSAELDFAAGAEDAVPRESERTAQDADDLACGAGMSGSAGDSAVGCDFAARDGADSGEDGGVERHGGYFSGSSENFWRRCSKVLGSFDCACGLTSESTCFAQDDKAK